MAAGRPRGAQRIRAKAGVARLHHFAVAVIVKDPEHVGIFLTPAQTCLFAIDADGQAVAFTHADLAGQQRTARAIGETQQDLAIVIDAAARNDGAQIGKDFSHLQAGNEFGQMKRMDANIGHAATNAGPCRIATPFGLLAGVGLGQPALRIFDHHLADRAKNTCCHTGAGFAHQRIA